MLESAVEMDTEYLSEVSGGDVEFEKELIQAFMDAAPDLIRSCVAGVESSDVSKVIYASHTLKGSSRSIGAQNFALIAEEIERAARVGDMSACRDLAPEIDVSFQRFAVVGREFLAA